MFSTKWIFSQQLEEKSEIIIASVLEKLSLVTQYRELFSVHYFVSLSLFQNIFIILLDNNLFFWQSIYHFLAMQIFKSTRIRIL